MADSAFVSSRPTIKIDGQKREDLQQALLAMQVNLPLHGCAHAELQLSNWGRPQGGDTPDFALNDIALGAGIDIETGDDQPLKLFSGEITAIEECYGEGAPSIALLLQDKLHRLARSRHNRSFEDQSPDEVLQSVASAAGLQTDVAMSGISANWLQLNESDLAFLLRLGKQFDVAVRLDNGRLRAKPEQADSNPLALSAQDSALKVRLLADLNHQALASLVNGYNLATAEAVDYRADALSPAPRGTQAAAALGNLSWPGEEIVPQPVPRSSSEAEAYAKAAFRRQAKRFVQGDIVCQGEPSLKPGREIDLDGVSPRLKGLYQIVHCVHRFDNNSGFETHLKVNKGGWQP
ncbi:MULTISPECIES: phage late control D family protein [Methylomonas]|uniref:phage late control D family protein n=1 Tax=Methylomonas TaxID=416 RepID=UPI001231E80F|nr:phage late control D family protein [Methylomonas rhizoryzae]